CFLLITDRPSIRAEVFNVLPISTEDDSAESVVVVDTVGAAIARTQLVLPAAILLDGELDSYDSFEVCETLRQQPALRSLPILMLVDASFDRAEGFRRGMTDFLLRPFQSQEVLQRLLLYQLADDSYEPTLALLHQQLHNQDHALAQAQESLKLLLHAVSHDLRNPVLGMQMVFQNLLNGTCQHHWTNEEMIPVPRSFVERMIEGSDRHLNLISALIDSHSEVTRPLALNPQWVNLGRLISTALQELEPWFRKNQATAMLQISPDLPLVKADPVQMSRVVKHLAENALKHNPPGVTLQVSAFLENDILCCVVQDDGQGIRSEDCDRLFRLSQRGDRAAHTFGLGLGLYLCQQIVQAHGGTIQVANVHEGGARFWFTLPHVAPCTCESAAAVSEAQELSLHS
ncbi:MAG: ATP-binding protein, partial [Cyanobacteria bacterium J06638_22]